MSDVLAKLQAVHAAREMVTVEVPEYGWTLRFAPLTLKDHAAIRRGVDPKDDVELMISGLIRLARNEDGTPFFEDTPALRAALHDMEYGVLLRIVMASGGDQPAETAKNA